MKREELLEKIAPCSLMCYTCGAYEAGVICGASRQLLKYMDGVGEFYRKHSSPGAEQFAVFWEELKRYGRGNCSGCRSREHHQCSIKDCFILDCVKEHHVDFCGECGEFPCSKTQKIFEKEVYIQWLTGNEEIKSSGIEAFWEKRKETPHYIAYKSLE